MPAPTRLRKPQEGDIVIATGLGKGRWLIESNRRTTLEEPTSGLYSILMYPLVDGKIGKQRHLTGHEPGPFDTHDDFKIVGRATMKWVVEEEW